jgi:uncharacterized protein with HEPN domain
MPSKSEYAALVDIQHYTEVATRIVGSQSYENFLHDEVKFLAVTRCLEIISEASRRLSEGMKSKHSHIEWVKIAAAGNVYRHDYEMIDTNQVWETVQLALPKLLSVVEAELKAWSI